MDLDEIGRVQQRAASIIVSLTPRLAKGNMGPGGMMVPQPQAPLGPDGNPIPQPDTPTHIVMGNNAIGTFMPGEEEKAEAYLAIIEKSLASARKEVAKDAAADIRKALDV